MMDVDFYNLVSKISAHWSEAEEILKSKSGKYNTIEDLKTIAFYNWLFQVLEAELDCLAINISELKVLYRGAKEENCSYDRFVPTIKHAKNNRMNRKDKVYHYFGVDYHGPALNAKETCIKEIRADNGDYISFCEFEIVEEYKTGKLINLRKDSRLPKTEKDVVKYLKGCFKKSGIKDLSVGIAKLLVNMFANSAAFDPIDCENNNGYKYAPFWAITDYIESRGYLGVIYDSTVCKGINMALFDVEYAKPILNPIETIQLKEGSWINCPLSKGAS